MKITLHRILHRLFIPRVYAATVAYSGLVFQIFVEAPNEHRALQEVDRSADGGSLIDLRET